MILQELVRYYERLAGGKGSLAPRGFEKKEIPFVIILGKRGAFKGIDDTRESGPKGRGRTFLVPKSVKRANNVAANLLWDNPSYVFGLAKSDGPKPDKRRRARLKEQRASFVDRIRGTFPAPIKDDGLLAVLRFLEAEQVDEFIGHRASSDALETGANLSFRLEGENRLVCERESVVKLLSEGESANGEGQVCLVTGENDVPARLHAAIKGVWGAQPTGANIISFNLNAFCSYGKLQGFNAPVGARAEHGYTTALNSLLGRGSRHRIQVGDASVVFWAEVPHAIEEWFYTLFGEGSVDNENQGAESLRALYASPKVGAPAAEFDPTPFCVLGLSPNASRLSVRFWHRQTVGDTVRSMKQHFEDCSIEHAPSEPDHLSLFRLLVATATQGKAENIPPNLEGELMRSILLGTPYPATLLSGALRRVRAEREVSYARASILKAVLVRQSRFYNRQHREVGMSLDRNNANSGYLLGRLFGVLERAQELASPGINATIRDRFYGSASSTPATTFPGLLKLKNHHISKLSAERKGAAVNLEKQIGEIVEKVDDFPRILSLQDQGRFAIGYYHQRQDFFRPSDKDDDSPTTNQ